MPAQALQAVLLLHVSPMEMGKESSKADRSTFSNAGKAQTMRALEPLGGTLTLLGIVSYVGNTTQLPAHLRATWKSGQCYTQSQPVSRPPLLPALPTSHLLSMGSRPGLSLSPQ